MYLIKKHQDKILPCVPFIVNVQQERHHFPQFWKILADEVFLTVLGMQRPNPGGHTLLPKLSATENNPPGWYRIKSLQELCRHVYLIITETSQAQFLAQSWLTSTDTALVNSSSKLQLYIQLKYYTLHLLPLNVHIKGKKKPKTFSMLEKTAVNSLVFQVHPVFRNLQR